MTKYERWSLFVQALSAFIICISVAYVAIEYAYSQKKDYEALRIDSLKYIESVYKDIQPDIDIIAARHRKDGVIMDQESMGSAINILNKFNGVAWKIQNDFYAENVIKEYKGDDIILIYGLLRPFIEKVEKDISVKKNPWEQLEKTIHKWTPRLEGGKAMYSK